MKNEEDIDKIELRSNDFQEVMGAVPPWILRWGITSVAIIIVILIIGSAIFKFPDTITSTVTITGTTPAMGIVAKSSGKLSKLYITDNQQVKQGEYLAIIENPAKTEDVLRLKENIQKIDDNLDTLTLIPAQQFQLGTMQSLYSTFYMQMAEYKQFTQLAYHLRKIEFTKIRIAQNEAYYNNMLRQQEVMKEQFKIARQQHMRDSILEKKGVLSKEELEGSYSQFLQSYMSLESTNRSLDNLQIQLSQMYETLYDTEYQQIDRKNTLETQLMATMHQLRNELETWEVNYVLTAPADGKITFSEYWTENQNVMAGDIVFNIVPQNQGQIIGKAQLPMERSGKVKIGQKVNIRFVNFPDHEYGMVKGYVKNISLVPSVNAADNVKSYSVDIELPDGLRTSYNKDLPFLPGMEGQADIITEDISLLQRFLLPLRQIVTEGIY